MFLVDRLLVSGIRFVLDKVVQAAEAESTDSADPARLREDLLAAQMRFELGEIDAEELSAVEARILPLLRDARGQAISTVGSGSLGVEIDFAGDGLDDETPSGDADPGVQR